MPMASEIVGSWFPTGYYGHFRSKSRNDFVCEYRQLAKPPPPDKFLRRSKEPCARHVFSTHDNRNSFMTDALYFEQGLGRKRSPTKAYSFKPDFYTWMPIKDEIERSRPEVSTYQLDFSARKGSVKQLLVKRPKTSFEGTPTTTYRYVHGEMAPNREEIRGTASGALQLTAHSRLHRAKTARPACRDTVASCLSWYRPKVPAATAVTDFSQHHVQHVPAPPQTAPPPSSLAQQTQQPPVVAAPPPPVAVVAAE
ncbi:ciliary microtubule inner protein 7-like [Babylonia areolata]|uniref:ciliary microtubule inner protein 7-like n=1 Tax=Babylonia areolata TaxID=304850 RepID=UPI003FD43338